MDTPQLRLDLAVKVIGGCLGVYFILSSIYNIFFHPLSRIPGPFIAKFSPLYRSYGVYRGDFHETTLRLHKKYGPVVRIAPNYVSVWSAEAVRVAHGLTPDWNKGDMYHVVRGGKSADDPDALHLLSEMDNKKRRTQRRLYGPAFTTAVVAQHEERVDRVLEDCIQFLRGKSREKVELEGFLHAAICDCLTEILFAEHPGFVKDGTDHGCSYTDWRAWRRRAVLGQSRFASRVYMALSRVLPLAYLDVDDFIRWLFPTLKKHFPEPGMVQEKEKSDVEALPPSLAKELKLLTQRKPEINPKWTAQMAMLTAKAGNLTTLSSALAFFATLAARPDVQARLVEEIRAAKVRGPVPGYHEVAELPYLDACLRDAMRLFPVGNVGLPRVVPPGGVVLDGYALPAGTVVETNPYVVHRNTDVFGADAEEFNPERWLGEDKDRRSLMAQSLLVWGGRSRSCAGQDLGRFMLLKVIGTLLANFEVGVEWDRKNLKDLTTSFICLIPGVRATFVEKGH